MTSKKDKIVPSEHFVQFYEDDYHLLKSLKHFLIIGEPALLIVNEDHARMLHHEFYSLGISEANYLILDAYEVLNKILVNNRPDPNLFEEILGNVIKKMGSGRKIRVFGEMVSNLWEEGNRTGAIETETFWNKLVERHHVKLFCGYPMRDFGVDDGENPVGEITSILNVHQRADLRS